MKKKPLISLKPGQKFRYKRKLYLVDSAFCPVHIITGKVANLAGNTVVTPVKLYIQAR